MTEGVFYIIENICLLEAVCPCQIRIPGRAGVDIILEKHFTEFVAFYLAVLQSGT